MASVSRERFQGREIKLYEGDKPTFDGQTSYRQTYKQHPLEPRTQFSPPQNSVNNAKFDGTSTYGQDFPAHPLQARPQTSQRASYQTIPFEGHSTYTETFKPHMLEPQLRHTSKHWQPNTAKFDGTSSYSNDYIAHAFQGVSPNGTAARRERPAPLPFEGTTTYRDEYPGWPFDPSAMPGNYALATHEGSNAPFDGTTSYREEYKAHTLEPRPATTGRKAEYTRVPFEGSTTHRDAYQGRPLNDGDRAAPVPKEVMRPSVPFDGTTCNREDFKGWQLPAKRPPIGVELLGDKMFVLIKPDASLPATGKQIFTTVHDDQAEMCILVLQGSTTAASDCTVLGQFDLLGLPAGPAGSVRVQVTLHLSAQNVLTASAFDLDSKRHERWLVEGAMVARSGSTS